MELIVVDFGVPGERSRWSPSDQRRRDCGTAIVDLQHNQVVNLQEIVHASVNVSDFRPYLLQWVRLQLRAQCGTVSYTQPEY